MQSTVHDVELRERLVFSRKTLDLLVQYMPAPSSNHPHILAVELFDSVATQHFRAIVMLTEARMTPASVAALCRPFAEAVVRGHWLRRCAGQAELRAFLGGAHFRFPKFDRMVASLSSIDPQMKRAFSSLSQGYGVMCDFTHTGSGQLKTYAGDRGGVTNTTYTRGLLILLEVMTEFALFSAIFGCAARGDEVAANVFAEHLANAKCYGD